MNMMDELALLESVETLSLYISKLMRGEKFEELFELFLEYDMNLESMKENFSVLMEFHDRYHS